MNRSFEKIYSKDLNPCVNLIFLRVPSSSRPELFSAFEGPYSTIVLKGSNGCNTYYVQVLRQNHRITPSDTQYHESGFALGINVILEIPTFHHQPRNSTKGMDIQILGPKTFWVKAYEK